MKTDQCPKKPDLGRFRAEPPTGVDQVMRTTNAQSHPLRFSVLSRTLPDEPTVVGVCEQDDPDDGFLVTVERPGGNPGIYGFHLTEPELQILGRVIQRNTSPSTVWTPRPTSTRRGYAS